MHSNIYSAAALVVEKFSKFHESELASKHHHQYLIYEEMVKNARIAKFNEITDEFDIHMGGFQDEKYQTVLQLARDFLYSKQELTIDEVSVVQVELFTANLNLNKERRLLKFTQCVQDTIKASGFDQKVTQEMFSVSAKVYIETGFVENDNFVPGSEHYVEHQDYSEMVRSCANGVIGQKLFHDMVFKMVKRELEGFSTQHHDYLTSKITTEMNQYESNVDGKILQSIANYLKGKED